MDFLSKLDAAVDKNDSLLCVGLDPDIDQLPVQVRTDKTPFLTFNKQIIDAVADQACAFKPNSAFYEARGAEGIAELKQTCDYLRQAYPHLPIILDYKRGDIGHTNTHYTSFAFDYLQVDAITIQPYLGREAVQPYLDRADKGIIVLCRTSNEGAGEFQDLQQVDGRPLYEHVAQHVAKEWNANNNCLLVVGATVPDELATVRSLVGDDMVFLVPGIGAQGGDLEATLKAGLNKQGRGLIINSSRAIIYADDPHQAAQTTRDEINKFRS